MISPRASSVQLPNNRPPQRPGRYPAFGTAVPSGTLHDDGVFQMDDVRAAAPRGEAIDVYLDDPRRPPPARQAYVEDDPDGPASPEASPPPLVVGSPPRHPPVPAALTARRTPVVPCACVRSGTCVCASADRCGCTGADGPQGERERAVTGAVRDAKRALDNATVAAGAAAKPRSPQGRDALSSREYLRDVLRGDGMPSALHASPSDNADAYSRDRDRERGPSFLAFGKDDAPGSLGSAPSPSSRSFERVPTMPANTFGPRPPGQPRPPPDYPMEPQSRPVDLLNGMYASSDDTEGPPTRRPSPHTKESEQALLGRFAEEPWRFDWPWLADRGIWPVGWQDGTIWPQGIQVGPNAPRLRGGWLKAETMPCHAEESEAEEADRASSPRRSNSSSSATARSGSDDGPPVGREHAAATDAGGSVTSGGLHARAGRTSMGYPPAQRKHGRGKALKRQANKQRDGRPAEPSPSPRKGKPRQCPCHARDGRCLCRENPDGLCCVEPATSVRGAGSKRAGMGGRQAGP